MPIPSRPGPRAAVLFFAAVLLLLVSAAVSASAAGFASSATPAVEAAGTDGTAQREPLWQGDRLARFPARPAPVAAPDGASRVGDGGEALDGDRSRSLTPLEGLARAVNIDSLMANLTAVSSNIATRYYRTGGMQQATQYALDRFLGAGCDSAYFDTFTYNGYSIRNVIGVKTGSAYPSRIYMICGHLDSTSPQRDTLAPGAEDNGSGAMGVLEAARLLAPLHTDATIYFVCFTAEEQGMVGSDHLAGIAQQQHWDLRGVLNMDMVGYDTPGDPSLWIEGFHSNAGSVALMDLLESVAHTYTDLEVYRYPGDGWGSDHEAFDAHGFSAVLAIDYNWDSYPCYHQTCDVIDNIVRDQYRRMIVTVTVAGAQLAGLQTRLGSIAGTADRTDSTNDAGIFLELPGTGVPPVLSGPGGAFSIPDLLPGRYTLRASAPGYITAVASVLVTEDRPTQVTIHLDPTHPSSAEERGIGTPAGLEVILEPNPFAGTAAIRVRGAAGAPVRLTIFDASGRRVRSLIDRGATDRGSATRLFSWDARDDHGRDLPAGTYWVRAISGGSSVIRPLVRLK